MVAEVGRVGAAATRTIAVFDFDGTLSRYDTFVRFLSLVLMAYPHRLAACWELPLDVVRHKCGRQDNTWLKQRFMRRILRGFDIDDLARIVRQLHEELVSGGFRTGALAELDRHAALGHRTLLMSASLDIYVEPIAKHLGFSDCLCSVAERDSRGVLTGRLLGENCLNAEKVRRLDELLSPDRQAWHVIAYGDSAADLALLEVADEAYMVNANKLLVDRCRRANVQTIQW